MDASLPGSDACCTKEQHLVSSAGGDENRGEETHANAELCVEDVAGKTKASVEDGGEKTQANVETSVEAPAEEDSRRSATSAHSTSEHSRSDDYSSTDEEDLRAEDHLRPSLCIDDVRDLDKATGAVRKRPEVQQRAQQTPKFETIYEMTRKFVHHFTTLHVERECDSAGVYVCVACSLAQRELAKIREAIRKDREGRVVALNNLTFMKLLVQLCNLDSPDVPRICTVSSPELQKYYKTSFHELVGTVTVLEDELSEKLWERFLGVAAKNIKTVSYAVQLKGTRTTDRNDYDGVDAFLKQATKRSQPKAESDADPPIESDSLIVADCLDARHMIVYDSLKAKEDATAMDILMAQCHQSSLNREPRREPPNVGDVVGLVLSSNCLQRVLVVKVIEDVAVVWSIDHGRFHNVHWGNLINVVPSMRSLPPALALAVLQDVDAVPFVKLLRECAKFFRVVTNHNTQEDSFHTSMVTKVTAFGMIDVLADLLHCPDYVTRMTAVKCLIQMCCRQKGRQAVAKAACVPKALLCLDDLARRHFQDDSVAMVTEEKRALLNLLQAMFFRNDHLRLECADTDVVAIIVKVHKSLPPTGTVYRDVERCLRAILGPVQERRCQPQPAYCNREPSVGYRQGPGSSSGAYRRQPPAYNRESEPSAQSRLVAMTPEKLKDTTDSSCYPTSEALQSAAAVEASRPIPTQIPKPMANVPPSSAITGGGAAGAPPGGRFYIRGMLVPLRSDETHEVRPLGSMKQVSARILANVACSFLNTWKPCSIYYGISPEGFVRGVMLNQEERDSLRRGIDFMAGNLRPHLTSTSFGVEFVPVLRHAADKPEEAHHYVVEVWVRGVNRMVYTTSDGDCYLRDGDMTYRARTHEVRAWIVRVEEEYYLQAKNSAAQEGAPAAVEDAPRPWDDVVA